MKICVLGAGVIGVSTAYALGRLGHEVIVIDKGAGVASGASHANGAQLSYAYIDPLAGPATRRKIPAYLMGSDPGVRFGFSFAPSYISWGARFIRECSSKRATKNLTVRSHLAQESRDALSIFESEIPRSALKRSSVGKLVLASSHSELKDFEFASQRKRGLGIDTEVLTKAECLRREPALKGWTGHFEGGVYSANDTSLDPVIYCDALKVAGEREFGTRYQFGETIEGIKKNGDHIIRVITDQAEYSCDKVIVCLGAEAKALLNGHVAPLPILPVRGYSVTLPAKEPVLSTSITDPNNKVVFTNIGQEIRIAGFMDAHLNEAKVQSRGCELLKLARTLWPEIADFDANPQLWSDFRPMTPSGIPIIGPSQTEGIYLNVGHGSLGYTFAAGSAMKIANIIGHSQTNV